MLHDQEKWVACRKFQFQFSFLLITSHMVPVSRDNIDILVMLKTIKYKGNWILLLASSNSFCLIPSHISFLFCFRISATRTSNSWRPFRKWYCCSTKVSNNGLRLIGYDLNNIVVQGVPKLSPPSLTHYILRYENSISIKEVCLDRVTLHNFCDSKLYPINFWDTLYTHSMDYPTVFIYRYSATEHKRPKVSFSKVGCHFKTLKGASLKFGTWDIDFELQRHYTFCRCYVIFT